jgi:hypothetical protein
VYGRPPEAFAHSLSTFPPELATPAMVYLSHDSCKLNGMLLASGGGQVLRIAVMENAGFTSDHITPEEIAANIETILDMSAAVNVGVGAGGGATMPTPKLASGRQAAH